MILSEELSFLKDVSNNDWPPSSPGGGINERRHRRTPCKL